GLAALEGQGVCEVRPDDATVSLRLLCDRREELVSLRTRTVCRLHRLLGELTPGGMRPQLSAKKAEEVLFRLRPSDEVGRLRLTIALEHLGDIRSLDQKIKVSAAQIAQLVKASGAT